MLTITRRLEFDAGHRIPDHRSQCRHLHGHRYVLEVTLTGQVQKTPGQSDNGMILDFAEVKRIAQREIVDIWDHAFLAYRHDKTVVDFLASLPGHKTVLFDEIPTAENLAQQAFTQLAHAYQAAYGQQLSLSKVRLYETPNCWAEVNASQLPCAKPPTNMPPLHDDEH